MRGGVVYWHGANENFADTRLSQSQLRTKMIPAQERFSLRASVARSMFWIAWSRGALQLLTFATTLLVTGAPAARLFLAHYRGSPRPSARPPQRRTHAEQRHTGLTEPFQPLEKVTSEVPCARTKASAQAEGYSVEVAGGHNLALAGVQGSPAISAAERVGTGSPVD
jgi:hypothetical protein